MYFAPTNPQSNRHSPHLASPPLFLFLFLFTDSLLCHFHKGAFPRSVMCACVSIDFFTKPRRPLNFSIHTLRVFSFLSSHFVPRVCTHGQLTNQTLLSFIHVPNPPLLSSLLYQIIPLKQRHSLLSGAKRPGRQLNDHMLRQIQIRNL